MNLNDVHAYFADRLTSMKFKEHTDGFNLANIPSFVLDQSFHVELGNIIGASANQTVHQFTMPVTVRVYFRDYRNPNQLREAALKRGQDILAMMLAPAVRLNPGVGPSDIRPSGLRMDPLSGSNDNALVLSLSFDVVLHFQF